MKKLMLILGMLAMTAGVFAQNQQWAFDQAHSSVNFTIEHMVISEVEGRFTGFDGTVSAKKADFSDAAVTFTVDINSISTNNEKRDNHLKSPDFFDAAKYPTMTFVSTEVKKGKKKHYALKGQLTMHGVTKPVELDVKYGGTIVDPYGNTRAGFKITGVLTRANWGLTYNAALEAGGLILGEEVEIKCNVELIKQ